MVANQSAGQNIVEDVFCAAEVVLVLNMDI